MWLVTSSGYPMYQATACGFFSLPQNSSWGLRKQLSFYIAHFISQQDCIALSHWGTHWYSFWRQLWRQGCSSRRSRGHTHVVSDDRPRCRLITKAVFPMLRYVFTCFYFYSFSPSMPILLFRPAPHRICDGVPTCVGQWSLIKAQV